MINVGVTFAFVPFILSVNFFTFYLLNVFQVKHCKNIEKARELWNSVMTQGHGAEGHMWMEYFQMEK